MPEIEPYRDEKMPDRFMRWIEVLRQTLRPIPRFSKAAGSPESVVTGVQGDRYFRTDGAPGTFVYVKTTNGGNTGWLATG
jgi:hypothetical protein